MNPDAFEIIHDETGTSERLDTNQHVIERTQIEKAPMPQEAPCAALTRTMNPTPNLKKKTNFIDVSKIAKANSSGLKIVLNLAGSTSDSFHTGPAIRTYSKQSNTAKSKQVSNIKPQVLSAGPTTEASRFHTKSVSSPSTSKESSSSTEGSKQDPHEILKPVMEKKEINKELFSELPKRKPKPNPKYFNLYDSGSLECKRKCSEIDENAGQKKIKHSQENVEQCDYIKKLNLCPKINSVPNIEGSEKNKTNDQSMNINSESTEKPLIKKQFERNLQEQNQPDKWQATSDAMSLHAMQIQALKSSKKQSPFCKLKRSFAHRRVLDLKTKVAIIEEVMEGTLKKKEVATKYDIPPSTISCILKNRQTILKHHETVPESRKRLSFNKQDREPAETINSDCPEIHEKQGEHRQRRSIDLFTKLSIIRELDKKLLNKKEVAKKFCIPASTLTMIVKDRARIELNSKFQCFNRKKFKRSQHTEVEIGLLEYLSRNITAGVKMTTTDLCNKAKSIARELGIENFKCEPSSSWIWRFKQRFNLAGEGFSDQILTKQIQKWHRLNNPHRPNNQKVFCDFCQTMCIGVDKMERHIVKKHLS